MDGVKPPDAENLNGFLNLGRRGPERGISFQAFGAESRAETRGLASRRASSSRPQTNFTVGDFEDLDQLQASCPGYARSGKCRAAFTAYVAAPRRAVQRQPGPDNNVRSLHHQPDRRRGTSTGAGRNPRPEAASPPAGGRWRGQPGPHPATGRDPIVPSTTLTTDVESPSYDVAGYALADLRINDVTFSGGFRYDYIHIPFEDQLDPAADTTNNFNRLSPRGGVSLDVAPGASVYASVGQSFRAPAVLELACADETAACPLPFALGDDPPLEPVVATTFEVGGQIVRGPAILTALGVPDQRAGRHLVHPVGERRVRGASSTTSATTRREGVELGVQVIPSERLSLYANYAFTHATFRDPAEIFSIRADSAFAGRPSPAPTRSPWVTRLPLVPDHQVKAGGPV